MHCCFVRSLVFNIFLVFGFIGSKFEINESRKRQFKQKYIVCAMLSVFFNDKQRKV